MSKRELTPRQQLLVELIAKYRAYGCNEQSRVALTAAEAGTYRASVRRTLERIGVTP